MSKTILGVDIGGTKCAVVLGIDNGGTLEIKDKIRFATTDVDSTISEILSSLKEMMARHGLRSGEIYGTGISCGGPLDSRIGVVMSPPNLPGWDNIPIVKLVSEATGTKADLQNDANACALAEWTYGAGKGSRNMAFLTFGTGLGAGLVLEGKLYTGTNDNAGELGHIRLAPYGPVGYGKAGSFEGFCSGGGIAQLAKTYVKEKLMMGEKVPWCPDPEKVDAKAVALAARDGDPLANRILDMSSEYLGMGLSILIDIINPEVIVIGSIYARNEDLMAPVMQKVIDREALPLASRVCRVVPAALGEAIGDYAAISVGAAL